MPLVVLTALLVLVPAGVAHADPARPTHYRSQVTELDPPTDAVAVEVVGGDAFLRIAVRDGHTATVYGYRGEPYLRIVEDGSVAMNLNSPAHYLNQDRYAAVPVPEGADPEAEPDWSAVADGGSYAWHDHRIHWMSPDLPRSVDTGSGGVQPVTELSPWEVQLAVDGTETVVRGELLWLPTEVPIMPLLTGLLAAGVGWFAAARSRRIVGVVLAAAGAAVVSAALGEGAIQPSGLTHDWANWGPPGLALVLAVVATAAPEPDRARTMLVLSGGLTGAWIVLRVGTLWLPVLPTALPAALSRMLVAAGAGLLLGVGADLVRQVLESAGLAGDTAEAD